METDKNLKILIADDNQGMRKTVRIILERIGYANISEARDGVQALAELKHARYDLLLSDWNMPNMDGLSLVRMVRSDAGLKDLMVIMITAEAERYNVIDAIHVGINDYIVKPFTADVVQKKIGSVTTKKTGHPKTD